MHSVITRLFENSIRHLSAIFIFAAFVSPTFAGTFWGKQAYFPNSKSLPEDSWLISGYFELQTQGWDKMKDHTNKKFILIFKTKDGKVLYEEKGKLKTGFVDAFIKWKDHDNVSIVIKPEGGKETILERHLKYDSKEHVYKTNQAAEQGAAANP